MRNAAAGRVKRRWIAAAAVVLAVAGLTVAVSVRPSGEQATPPEMSIDAALAAFGSATDYYLHIASIPGDSLASKHSDDIDIQTFSWGVTNSAGNATGGRFTSLTVTKYVDPASPLLMKVAAAGTSLGTVVLFAERSTVQPFEYLRLTIVGTKVRSFKQSGDRAQGIIESVGLGFTKITLRYTKQNQAGGVGAVIERCWNLATKTAC